MLDTMRGLGIVLFIAALAGAIAYVGDRVGHQVGRKRLTLFKIRPKYTSTIIAVGTGVVIALAVTIGALLASQQVQTAFFHMNEINSRIQALQSRETELQQKLNNGHLVVATGQLMVPFPAVIPKGSSESTGYEVTADFLHKAASYVNSIYTQLDLKPFIEPKNQAALLEPNVRKAVVFAKDDDVLLLATSYQNLYEKDRIHFQIQYVPDRLVYRKGTFLNALTIPAGKNVNMNLAVQQLEAKIARQAIAPQKTQGLPLPLEGLALPEYLGSNVQALSFLPTLDKMQNMVTSGKGTYILAAFAAYDVYPHTFGIPVVLTLQHSATLQ